MSFQKLILVSAIIILIVVLVIIGFTLSKQKKDEYWPPIVGDCPDYWVDLEGNGAACYNAHKLGKCNIPSKGNKNTMNFTVSPFLGDGGTCAKYKWADRCGVTWDGITSGVVNPCDTSTQ
jgi:hypothetical protein